jgi:hypothetical protein
MKKNNSVKADVISRFSLKKEEADLYFHLLDVTKNKPHNIIKDIAYQRALVLESKGLVTIKDYGDRVHIWATNGL